MNEEILPFQKVLELLLDESKDIPRRYLAEFSDIEPASLTSLLEAWPHVEPDRKLLLIDQLNALANEDTLVSFDDLGRALLADSDPKVRIREYNGYHTQTLIDLTGEVEGYPLTVVESAGASVGAAPGRGGSAVVWTGGGRDNLLCPELGGIEVGKRADVAVLDAHYRCLATFIEGQMVYVA